MICNNKKEVELVYPDLQNLQLAQISLDKGTK